MTPIQGMTLTKLSAAPLCLLLLAALASPAVGAPKQDAAAPIATCEKHHLSPSVERLIMAALTGYLPIAQKDCPDDRCVERAAAGLRFLLESKDPHAIEAQVALLAYYIGDASGDALIDSLAAHAAEADPLVARYRVCRPPTSWEKLLSGVTVSRSRYDAYEGKRSGKAAATR